MAAGNQTRIGFTQSKPGQRRALDSKRTKPNKDAEAGSQDDRESSLTREELLLQRADKVFQTMEEKLAQYRKKKEEKTVQKDTRQMRLQSITTSDMKTESNGASTTQRTLRQSTRIAAVVSKTQASIDSHPVSESARNKENDQTKEAAKDLSGYTNISKTGGDDHNIVIISPDSTDLPTRAKAGSEAPPSPAQTVVSAEHGEAVLKKVELDEGAADEEAVDDKTLTNEKDFAKPVETDTVQSTAPYKVTQKPVVEDTILQDSSEGCFTEKEVEGEDEDNIHPLARTVVKVAPRSRKPQVEEEIINTNSPKVDTRSPYNIPAKVAQMTTIREPKTDAFTLPLPSHMAVLLANFNAFENLLIFSKRQGRPCFYHRLKRHVELHSSRNFEISHLAQFKTLLPEGYRFTAAPCMVDGVKTRSIFIEMLNLEDESNHFVPQAEKRKKLFLERLHNHVKAFHQKFLTSTTPPRTDTYPRSWHPEFDLESVTPVEESEVPLLKPAVIDVWKVDLKDLRSQNHVRQQETKTEVPASTTSDVEEKKSVASAESDKNDTTSIPTTTTTPITDTSSATKPLTALEQLKERIRLKQLEMKEASKTLASPEEKHERLIASRLPNVFDLVRFKRVDVTPLKSLVELVVKSSRMPISEVEGRESLEMLAKFLPEWCTVFSLADGCQYFKVLRDNEKGEKIAHDERALRARLVSKSSRKP